jgi:hypothetical protein
MASSLSMRVEIRTLSSFFKSKRHLTPQAAHQYNSSMGLRLVECFGQLSPRTLGKVVVSPATSLPICRYLRASISQATGGFIHN